ncbi:hypothetical protein EU527_19550, partial [Candidatus Thorarchaeota archaeon]
MNQDTKVDKQRQKMSMRIEGMHCASCVASIEKSLLNQDGVISATVSLLDEKAVIEYDKDRVDRMLLEKAIESTGYRPRRATMTITLTVSPTESQWIEIIKIISDLSGTIDVHIFQDKNRILVEYDEDLITQKIVKRELGNLGYEVADSSVSSVDRE